MAVCCTTFSDVQLQPATTYRSATGKTPSARHFAGICKQDLAAGAKNEYNLAAPQEEEDAVKSSKGGVCRTGYGKALPSSAQHCEAERTRQRNRDPWGVFLTGTSIKYLNIP